MTRCLPGLATAFTLQRGSGGATPARLGAPTHNLDGGMVMCYN